MDNLMKDVDDLMLFLMVLYIAYTLGELATMGTFVLIGIVVKLFLRWWILSKQE